jgi:hypothetical protein
LLQSLFVDLILAVESLQLCEHGPGFPLGLADVDQSNETFTGAVCCFEGEAALNPDHAMHIHQCRLQAAGFDNFQSAEARSRVIEILSDGVKALLCRYVP